MVTPILFYAPRQESSRVGPSSQVHDNFCSRLLVLSALASLVPNPCLCSPGLEPYKNLDVCLSSSRVLSFPGLPASPPLLFHNVVSALAILTIAAQYQYWCFSPSPVSTLSSFVSSPFSRSGFIRPTNSRSTVKRQGIPPPDDIIPSPVSKPPLRSLCSTVVLPSPLFPPFSTPSSPFLPTSLLILPRPVPPPIPPRPTYLLTQLRLMPQPIPRQPTHPPNQQPRYPNQQRRDRPLKFLISVPLSGMFPSLPAIGSRSTIFPSQLLQAAA